MTVVSQLEEKFVSPTLSQDPEVKVGVVVRDHRHLQD